MERVSVFEGDETTMPLLLIAPHGPDDENTALITEKICETIGCFGVINRGFERADVVDYFADKANCNNIDHCLQDVVREEFLEPIQKYINRILLNLGEANIFLIHGMSDKKEGMDLILGYGATAGKDSSPKAIYSCDLWRKNALLYIFENSIIKAYNGKGGGKYAGAQSTNLNQLYRSHEFNEDVHSMQLELSRTMRMGDKGNSKAKSDEEAGLTADLLSSSFEHYLDFLNCRQVGRLPSQFSHDWEEIGKKRPSY